MTYNSLNIEKLEKDDLLYLVRYSQQKHPDFVLVQYKSRRVFVNGQLNIIKYSYMNGKTRMITSQRYKHRLFENKDEMARSLYDCFVKRGIILLNEYKKMCKLSQENRPELWI